MMDTQNELLIALVFANVFSRYSFILAQLCMIIAHSQFTAIKFEKFKNLNRNQ